VISKSFVDLLFILLCSTIVMLSDTVRVKQVDLAPAEVGGGAISATRAEDVVVVAVSADGVTHDGRSIPDAALPDSLPVGASALLSPSDENVTHFRVMRVWSSLRSAGVDAHLGVVDGLAKEAGDE